ncbi:nucleoside hydrolase [Amycolatopsis sp. H20-H5]|uniref:nucleoside hydrolase n=1 Tax=Amycolatopsis sp. H20-H5 TaxID=3046309 RepID=UPI002DBA987C|nr:nucleoside hydrolase [Amycolatopsis sp. H20-H5]MEC3981598.1 nucleoside hydrolase [Amycolatopsis sp. H20-H5]
MLSISATLSGIVVALGVVVGVAAVKPNSAAPATTRPLPHAVGEKVIFDTDFGQLNDDSQALYLLLQSGADVVGVTTVTGNTWAAEGAAYALKQLELVHRNEVPVYEGASNPLLGSRQSRLAAEGAQFGKVSYTGAWKRDRPADYRHLATTPYLGYARTTKVAGSAAGFIADQVKRNPHQITLFVLGPATNVALAVTEHPEIVALVKQVIYMGGAYDVPGNQGPAAEFNVWFDPEAGRIAVNSPFAEQIIVPLDVYDALAAGVFLEPALIQASSTRKVQVDTTYRFDYGHTLGYLPSRAPVGTSPARIVQRIDVAAFFSLCIRNMTGPVRGR